MDVTKAKAQPVQQVQAAKRPEQTQQIQHAQAQKPAESKPRPNVNGQGQTIGTRLSVTA
ncbi:MAG: hypothetical protein RL302_226 [Pseudomonadota bacterium]|jgi:lipopolysaccharide biosynthesis protein